MGKLKVEQPMLCIVFFQTQHKFLNICLLVSLITCFRNLFNWERKGNFEIRQCNTRGAVYYFRTFTCYV